MTDLLTDEQITEGRRLYEAASDKRVGFRAYQANCRAMCAVREWAALNLPAMLDTIEALRASAKPDPCALCSADPCRCVPMHQWPPCLVAALAGNGALQGNLQLAANLIAELQGAEKRNEAAIVALETIGTDIEAYRGDGSSLSDRELWILNRIHRITTRTLNPDEQEATDE